MSRRRYSAEKSIYKAGEAEEMQSKGGTIVTAVRQLGTSVSAVIMYWGLAFSTENHKLATSIPIVKQEIPTVPRSRDFFFRSCGGEFGTLEAPFGINSVCSVTIKQNARPFGQAFCLSSGDG